MSKVVPVPDKDSIGMDKDRSMLRRAPSGNTRDRFRLERTVSKLLLVVLEDSVAN